MFLKKSVARLRARVHCYNQSCLKSSSYHRMIQQQLGPATNPWASVRSLNFYSQKYGLTNYFNKKLAEGVPWAAEKKKHVLRKNVSNSRVVNGWCQMITLPETNIAPENRPSQKETSIPTIHFRCELLVSGRVICWGLNNSTRSHR